MDTVPCEGNAFELSDSSPQPTLSTDPTTDIWSTDSVSSDSSTSGDVTLQQYEQLQAQYDELYEENEVLRSYMLEMIHRTFHTNALVTQLFHLARDDGDVRDDSRDRYRAQGTQPAKGVNRSTIQSLELSYPSLISQLPPAMASLAATISLDSLAKQVSNITTNPGTGRNTDSSLLHTQHYGKTMINIPANPHQRQQRPRQPLPSSFFHSYPVISTPAAGAPQHTDAGSPSIDAATTTEPHLSTSNRPPSLDSQHQTCHHQPATEQREPIAVAAPQSTPPAAHLGDVSTVDKAAAIHPPGITLSETEFNSRVNLLLQEELQQVYGEVYTELQQQQHQQPQSFHHQIQWPLSHHHGSTSYRSPDRRSGPAASHRLSISASSRRSASPAHDPSYMTPLKPRKSMSNHSSYHLISSLSPAQGGYRPDTPIPRSTQSRHSTPAGTTFPPSTSGSTSGLFFDSSTPSRRSQSRGTSAERVRRSIGSSSSSTRSMVPNSRLYRLSMASTPSRVSVGAQTPSTRLRGHDGYHSSSSPRTLSALRKQRMSLESGRLSLSSHTSRTPSVHSTTTSAATPGRRSGRVPLYADPSRTRASRSPTHGYGTPGRARGPSTGLVSQQLHSLGPTFGAPPPISTGSSATPSRAPHATPSRAGSLSSHSLSVSRASIDPARRLSHAPPSSPLHQHSLGSSNRAGRPSAKPPIDRGSKNTQPIPLHFDENLSDSPLPSRPSSRRPSMSSITGSTTPLHPPMTPRAHPRQPSLSTPQLKLDFVPLAHPVVPTPQTLPQTPKSSLAGRGSRLTGLHPLDITPSRRETMEFPQSTPRRGQMKLHFEYNNGFPLQPPAAASSAPVLGDLSMIENNERYQHGSTPTITRLLSDQPHPARTNPTPQTPQAHRRYDLTPQLEPSLGATPELLVIPAAHTAAHTIPRSDDHLQSSPQQPLSVLPVKSNQTEALSAQYLQTPSRLAPQLGTMPPPSPTASTGAVSVSASVTRPQQYPSSQALGSSDHTRNVHVLSSFDALLTEANSDASGLDVNDEDNLFDL